MHNILRIASLCAALICISPFIGAQISPGRPMPETVTVHVDGRGDQGLVSPQMFGSFIEPIDNSINNGVVAEVLVNGSFEGGLWSHWALEQLFREQPDLIESTNQTGIPLPWHKLSRKAGNRYELHVGQAANSWQSLELIGEPGELTGIAQQVYLPVRRTLEYKVSLYVKHVSGPTKLQVSLRSTGDGSSLSKVLASSEIDASAPTWTKYSANLRLEPGQLRRLQAAEFAVAVEGDERAEIDQISLLPADAIGTLDPDVVRMARAMNLTELRLGGNFSSYYHWRDGVGPLDKRLAMENIAWGIPEYNNFGTDEFLEFCKLAQAEPQFDLNLGSGTPEEAVDWVRYIREHYQGPLILEMGNELYGKWQVGAPTLNELPARTVEFSKALREAAPDAELLATGETPGHFDRWNAALLATPTKTFDLLTTHFIVGTNHVVLQPYTPDFMAAAAYAVPYVVGENLDRMQAQVDASPNFAGQVHFAVTEWLFNSKGTGERNFTNESPSSRNEGGAVMIASTFNTFFRHSAEVKLVDMTGLMEFAGIWKEKEQVFASPAYYIFKMYSKSKGQTVLPVTTDSGTYNVEKGTDGYATARDVPYVDVVATRSRDGRELTVFCVNRSLTIDEPIRLILDGFRPGGSAGTEQIGARSRYERNDEVEPENVVPQPENLALKKEGTALVVLPHESVTAVHFVAR